MMTRTRNFATPICCLSVLALVLGAGASTASANDWQQDQQRADRNRRAQQERYRRSRQAQQDRFQQSRYQQNRQRFQDSGNRSQAGGSQGMSDWALIAYDIDGDDSFDVYEYILLEDLSQARHRTQRKTGMDTRRMAQRYSNNQRGNYGNMQQDRMYSQRNRGMDRGSMYSQRNRGMSQDRMAGQRFSGMSRDRMASQQGQRSKTFQMKGQIRDLKTVSLVGFDQPHRIAKLDTQQGVVRVDLGPKNSVDQLNLGEGDRISVKGSEGRMNDRRMLIAHRVKSNGDTVQINRQRSGKQRKVEGQVVATRTASFRGADQPHKIARVRTQEGDIVQVDLGQHGRNRQVDVSEGDDITAIGQCGKINNRSALFAQQVQVNEGQFRSLARADSQLLQRGQGQSRQTQQ